MQFFYQDGTLDETMTKNIFQYFGSSETVHNLGQKTTWNEFELATANFWPTTTTTTRGGFYGGAGGANGPPFLGGGP